ncbi:MAG: hypothetical protein Q9169_008173 [Polycauliona sp. 2 TL-2023]
MDSTKQQSPSPNPQAPDAKNLFPIESSRSPLDTSNIEPAHSLTTVNRTSALSLSNNNAIFALKPFLSLVKERGDKFKVDATDVERKTSPTDEKAVFLHQWRNSMLRLETLIEHWQDELAKETARHLRLELDDMFSKSNWGASFD